LWVLYRQEQPRQSVLDKMLLYENVLCKMLLIQKKVDQYFCNFGATEIEKSSKEGKTNIKVSHIHLLKKYFTKNLIIFIY
jgi:hypothetical protein